MKVYIPNKSYLVPTLSIDGVSGQSYFDSIFTGTQVDCSSVSFSENGGLSGSATFASIDFDIENINFDLYWANFGYAGYVARNIRYFLIPDITDVLKAQGKTPSPDCVATGTDSGVILYSIPISFAVVIDPYEEYSDEIALVEDLANKYSIYGTKSGVSPSKSKEYARSVVKSLYSKFSSEIITQTSEVYVGTGTLYLYEYVKSGSDIIIGAKAVLGDEELVPTGSDAVPFSKSSSVIYQAEWSYTAESGSLDSIMTSYNLSGVFRDEVNDITKIDDVQSDADNLALYLNLFEIFAFFSCSSSKSLFNFVNAKTDTAKNEALQKLVNQEGSVYTKIFGTPKASLTGSETSISDLFDSPVTGSSIILKSFTSSVILDNANDFVDPGYTDFYYIITPGIDLATSSHYEVLSDMIALINNRTLDCIYLGSISSFTFADNGDIDYTTLKSIDSIKDFATEELVDSKNVVVCYPDGLITHPLTGELVLADGALIELIKFGELAQSWRSPAGARRGIVDFIANLSRKINKGDADTLYTYGHVNPILRPTKYSSPRIEGNRTLYKKSSRVKSALSNINVVGAIQYIVRVLREAAPSQLFETFNTAFTNFVDLVSPTFDRLVADGVLETYEIVDQTTDDDKNNGNLRIGIAILPVREVERIYIRLYITKAGSTITIG